MEKVISRDGTQIAFDEEGSGPAVVLIARATCTRLSWTGPEISKHLSPRFTVLNYDGRGRGDSGDSVRYAVEKEIDDIAALIDAAGGRANLFAHSSGACLALEAAVRLDGKVGKIALYEAPYNDDPGFGTGWSSYLEALGEPPAKDRRGEAIALFMSFVGVPEEEIEEMQSSPAWPSLEAVVPTLAYDHAYLMADPRVPKAKASAVTVPVLVMCGSASFPFMSATAHAPCEAIPQAGLHTIDGQGHAVSTEAIAPVLADFFSPRGGT